jgi:microcin C transport system substrate-binding protein
MNWTKVLLAALLLSPICLCASAAEPPKSYGLSAFGNLKYKSDFTHFDYVRPDAPKRGTISLPGIDSFDSLNAFILKGEQPQGLGLIHAALMEPARDEADSLYGYVAESVEMPADKSSITFNLNPKARFSDGSAITADDVVFTYETLIKDGHPSYRIILAGVEKAETINPHRVRFTFRLKGSRDLPLKVGVLPVLSKAYFSKVVFKRTTTTAPVGAGPYIVGRVEPGRSITYALKKDYWAKDLPVLRGRYNFAEITFDYFRDRDIAFEAFFAGAYDFREEFTSRSWATQYDDKPPIKKGLIVRKTLPDETPSGVQAFFLNTRRAKFSDRRVRKALDLAFDYEWTNKTLFYSQYKRTNSMFANSELAADNKPSPDELKLLEPLRGKVPDEVFTTPYLSSATDGTGRNRTNLRRAMKLLTDAGYAIKSNKLVGPDGKVFTIEFLLFEASFKRIINPYVRNLLRIGIDATIRIVDVANFQNRMRSYDFDTVVSRYVQPLTPGIEQQAYFSSKFADVPGQRNLAGIKNPAVDYLIDKIIGASTRPALVTAVRALDRVIMWNHYVVPQWYKGVHNIAYWNKFDRPKIKPSYDLGMLDTWWFNPQKAAMIKQGKVPAQN